MRPPLRLIRKGRGRKGRGETLSWTRSRFRLEVWLLDVRLRIVAPAADGRADFADIKGRKAGDVQEMLLAKPPYVVRRGAGLDGVASACGQQALPGRHVDLHPLDILHIR
jgi:hypothetical protein